MTCGSPVCMVVTMMSAHTARPSKDDARRRPLPERRLGEAHHLRGVAIDAHEVGLECRAVERRHEEGLVLAGGELVDGCLRALSRLLRLRVHALTERAHVVDRQRPVETDGGDAEGADMVLAGERDHPAVAACHVDHLARHAELLEVARGPLGALGDGLAGLEHADGHGEGLRPEIGRELPLRRLGIDHGVEAKRGVNLCQAKEARVGRMGAGIRTMARYRIVRWQDIPSVVEASDGDRTVRRPLSPRFQDSSTPYYAHGSLGVRRLPGGGVEGGGSEPSAMPSPPRSRATRRPSGAGGPPPVPPPG